MGLIWLSPTACLEGALFIVSGVGWTSESEVHRTPRRCWWTALRLSTHGDLDGFMSKPVGGRGWRCSC